MSSLPTTTACPQKPPKKHQPIPSDITEWQRNWAGASTGSDHPLPFAHSAKSPHLPRASLRAQDQSRGAPSTHPKQPVPNPQSIQSPACPQSPKTACPQSPTLPQEPVPNLQSSHWSLSPKSQQHHPRHHRAAAGPGRSKHWKRSTSPLRAQREKSIPPPSFPARAGPIPRSTTTTTTTTTTQTQTQNNKHLPHQLPCVTKYL
jgi:hypothetical protein